MDIGSILVNQQFAVPVTLYDTEKLQADLSAGVANVMAGVGGAHILDIDTGQGFALFRHTSAVYDAPAGTGYSGDLRCALGITSNGLMAGFNRKSDGAWVNSLVIDATTGSATFTGAINAESGNFTGTVTAGAIIAGSATIAGASGNTTLDDVIASSSGVSYTTDDLEVDLAAGVGAIVAGVGSDYHLTVDSDNGFIVAGRNGSVFKGTATPGIDRPALGLSAQGIAMGYNRSSDGGWVDGVAIDASGNSSFSGSINATSGNFTGTVTAGSFIVSGAKLDNAAGATIASLGQTALWSSVSARPTNIAALTGTEAILNSTITISGGAISGIGTGSGTAVANSSITVQSNGLLVGGGGGQVTIGGLGYNGALDATRNAVTYSSTAPTSPTNGDLWCDTSAQPYAWKMRVGTQWQTSANLITSSTPVANYIAANSISADRLSVTSLSAISANIGTITAGSLSASVSYAGSITAGQITTGTLSAGITMTGSLVVSTAGNLSSGATAILTGNGYYFDYNGGTPRFRVGQVSSGALTNGIYYDGSSCLIRSQGSNTTSVSGASGWGFNVTSACHYIHSTSTASSTAAIVGRATGNLVGDSCGVLGMAVDSTSTYGCGVVGFGKSIGGYFSGTAANSAGLTGVGRGTGAGMAATALGSGTGLEASSASGMDVNCKGSKKIGFNSADVYIKHDGTNFRVKDATVTDGYFVLLSASTSASGTGATLVNKLAGMQNTTQAGWMTVKVGSATAYVPYWL